MDKTALQVSIETSDRLRILHSRYITQIENPISIAELITKQGRTS